MKCRNCKNNTLLDDGKQFSWCEILHDNLDIDEERYCGAFSPSTNADRIRAMTDKELAKWLTLAFQRVLKRNPMLENPPTYDGWLDWLKQEENKDA